MRVFNFLLAAVCLVLAMDLYAQPSYNMETRTVTDTAGFLYDNGGPFADYTNDQSLTFTIAVGAGKALKLQFLESNLETNELSLSTLCIYDYIEIFDGPATLASASRYCGNTIPPVLTSTTGTITVRFTSDGGGVAKGFKAYWTTGALLPAPTAPTYCTASGPSCSKPANFYILSVDVDGTTYTNNVCNNDTGSFKAYSSYIDSVFTMSAGTPSIVTVENNGLYELTDVYIDWNNDGNFDAGSESYLGVNAAGIGVATVVPPATALPGFKRMRVRMWDPVFQVLDSPIGSIPVVLSCGESSYGEVEDYTVLFTNPLRPIPDCATGFSPANAAKNVCMNTVISWATTTRATSYKFSLKETGGATLVNTVLTATSYDASALLMPGKSYTYLVTPSGTNGDALGCSSVEFTTSGNLDPRASVVPSGDTIEACRNTPFGLNGTPTLGTTPYKHAWTGTGLTYLNSGTVVNPVFNGTAVGTYKLKYTVTDTNNCKGTDSLVIHVISEANGGVVKIGPDTACANTPFRLQVSGLAGSLAIEDSTAGGVWNNIPYTVINDSVFEVTESKLGKIYIRTLASGTNCSDYSTNIDSVVVIASPALPVIAVTGNDTVCAGQTVLLRVTNYNSNLIWNDAAATQNDTLVVNATGNYTVTYVGVACTSSASVAITVGYIPEAKLEYVGNLTTCADETPVLYTTIQAGETVLWSNGATTRDISPAVSGKYYVTVTNAFGCSRTSDTVNVIINAIPDRPVISVSGPANPCEGEPVILSSSYGGNGNLWNTGATTNSITIRKSGSFYVSYTDGNGCRSYSDTISKAFRAAPVKPAVTISGKLNTCIGDSVKLTVNTPGTPTWNDAAATADKSLVVYTNGFYFAKFVNAEGCQVFSDSIRVEFTQYQPTPVITVSGTFCEGTTALLVSSLEFGNTWNDAAQTKNDTLRITTGGTYRVKNVQNGVCVAFSEPVTVSFVPKPATPSVTQSGDSLFSSVLGYSY
ncbi:MAG: CUB domain-containing protein, partial [Bacteroidota bacterium]